MSEASSSARRDDSTSKAAKDKNCPYCGQAFTSSSLGRHLDLYIKERNPKRPDGIHDVDEIRRARGGITRRQPKTSRSRHTLTPAGTPAGSFQRSRNAASDDGFANARSPADAASVFPIGGVRWEATGVMNELMADSPRAAGEAANTPGSDMRGFNPSRQPPSSQAAGRQPARPPPDPLQKVQDALDDARAAELALREFTSAWRAAKQQIELGSMPFDFDPLTMNFPALVLQCLRPQPTLFASTQLPTPSCWSTLPPGESQFEALKDYFKEEFRKFKVKCASATTALYEELKYPPPSNLSQIDRRQAVERAERTAVALEAEANKHLQIAFEGWKELPQERQAELWVLELARGIATKQADIDKLKAAQSSLVQETTSLKNQMEQLTRLQQPREFRLVPPAHIPMNERVLFELQDAAVTHGNTMTGLNINDRHSDLSTLVATSIKRWKNVIQSTRIPSNSMGSQRPLNLPPMISMASPIAYQPPAVPQPAPGTEAAAATPPAAATTPSSSSPNQQSRTTRVTNRPPIRFAKALMTAPTVAKRKTSRSMPPPKRASKRKAVTKKATKQAKRTRGGDDGDDNDDEEEEEDEEAEEAENARRDRRESSDDDTTPPAQQQNSTAPGTTGSEASEGGYGDGNGNGDENDENDDEDANDNEDENEDKEMSEEDADAEMDDGDEFAHMHTPMSLLPATATAADASPAASTRRNQTATKFKSPLARAMAQQVPRTVNDATGLVNASRSMPSIRMTLPTLGDAMYMD